MNPLNTMQAASRAGHTFTAVVTALPEPLTPRQREVLALLCEGLPNKTIARRLDITSGTVKLHVTSIMHKMRVASRLQAVVAAHELGLELKPGTLALVRQEAAIVTRGAAALRHTPSEGDASCLLATAMNQRFTRVAA